MNEQEQRSVPALSLMAAFADGGKHEREREEIRRIAGSTDGQSAFAVAP
ncbi:MAG TPA: hypothetical protein PKO41_01735 [Dokdonella sp.]|nr:hypothetical protein [Dokdonella sp.]MBX3692731.1 hypothetical protein [Dokdonella sp.]MCW5567680.1 hypothetical protein [Dokdonella sp.]HNR91122.1 hypothetical protein [Dokdonella sp.]